MSGHVWLVWVMENFEIEGRRKLHSIHLSREKAYGLQKRLPKRDLYYTIEKRKLTDE